MSMLLKESAVTPELGQALFLAELLSECERSLFHFITLLVENNVAAETILSEAFIVVSKDLDNFSDLNRAKLEVFRVALEKAREYEANGGDPVTVIIELPEGQTKVSHETLLTYAMTRLPASYRTIFFLADVMKFHKEDVAEIARLPLKEVKSVLLRARLMVRRVLLKELNVLIEKDDDAVFPQVEADEEPARVIKH